MASCGSVSLCGDCFCGTRWTVDGAVLAGPRRGDRVEARLQGDPNGWKWSRRKGENLGEVTWKREDIWLWNLKKRGNKIEVMLGRGVTLLLETWALSFFFPEARLSLPFFWTFYIYFLIVLSPLPFSPPYHLPLPPAPFTITTLETRTFVMLLSTPAEWESTGQTEDSDPSVLNTDGRTGCDRAMPPSRCTWEGLGGDHMCEDAGVFVCQEEDTYCPGPVDLGWRARK